jgi:hypothetical protein
MWWNEALRIVSLSETKIHRRRCIGWRGAGIHANRALRIVQAQPPARGSGAKQRARTDRQDYGDPCAGEPVRPAPFADIEPSCKVNSFCRIVTHSDRHRESLAILVNRLVAFLQEQQTWHNPSVPKPVPDGLARVFDTFSHHLVVLMLVAHSDNQVRLAERDVILGHCAYHAMKTGIELTAQEMAALEEYLRHFRPTQFALLPAIARLKQASHAQIERLVAAAHDVVDADGEVRLQEVLFLRSLRHDLAALRDFREEEEAD